MTVFMSTLSMSMSWLRETWCSWVSSQYASNWVVRLWTWSSSVVEGLTRSSSLDGGGGGGGDGGWVDDCLASPYEPSGIPNLDCYALSSSSFEGSLLKSYTSSGLSTPGLSFLTIIALIGCIQASLSFRSWASCCWMDYWLLRITSWLRLMVFMSSLSMSMSWLRETWCSWVSS